MKHLAIVFALALSLGGCANLQTAFQVATSTVTNPVQPVNIYQVKTVYSAALDLADRYRRYCWGRPFKAIMDDPIAKPICEHRRSVQRAINDADDHAYDAISRAEVFVRNNPTINAASVVREAWAAVLEFQRAAPVAAK